MTTKALEASVALNMGKAQPALSATSDMPTEVTPGPALSASGSENSAPPAPAPTAAPTPTAAPADPAAKAPAEGEDPAAGDKEDKTPAWQKAEITKERNRRREAEDRATSAEKKADEANQKALEALDAIKKLVPETPDPSVAPRPNRKDFDNPDTYDQALEKWTEDRVTAATRDATVREIEARTASEKAEQDRKTAEEANQAVFDTWSKRAAKVAEEMPDFEEVVYREVKDGGPNITEPMRDAILSLETGPQIAYHLAKNPQEALRISGMPILQQLVEIGRLTTQIEAAAKPGRTNTPPPPQHISGTEGAGPKDIGDMSMDEYAAARTPKLRGGRH